MLVIRFELDLDDLIYVYQWAVFGSVYLEIEGGKLPPAIFSDWAGNGGWYAGTELHHRAGAKDPKELAYEGCFFGPPQ